MNKLLTLEAAKNFGGIRVFTNGVFDILHVGHVRYLQAARALGDCLIVGLNSDASARALKGEGHPIVPQDERAELLAALACVDYIVLYDGVTAERVVDALKPEVYVKGGDYSVEGTQGTLGEISGNRVPPEARIVLGYGGRVEFMPFVVGKSTTNIIAEILNRHAR